jgi:hypothetical protein
VPELPDVTMDDRSLAVWYYADAGQPVGPLTLVDLRRQLTRLPAAHDRMVWREGWEDWQRLAEVPEFERPRGRLTKLRTAFLGKVGFAIGAVAAAALGVFIGDRTGREFGLNFWIPVICLSVAFLAASAAKVPRALIPELGVAAGQWLWFFAGLALSLIFGTDPASILVLAAEIALLGILLFWLWFTQSMPAALGLAVYEILRLAYSLYIITQDGPSVVLVIHVVLALAVLAGAYYAMLKLPALRALQSASVAERGW